MVSINLGINRNKYLVTPFILHDRFSKEECKKILADVKTQDNSYAFDEDNEPNNAMRIRFREESSWLVKKIIEIFLEINSNYYKFDIHEMDEMGLLRYKKGGSIDWHSDNEDLNQHLENKKKTQDIRTRKITLSLLLSEPNDFDGGNLEFNPPFPVEVRQGSVAVFPAYLVHRITPVTRGIRYALIASVKGPVFR